MGNRDYCPQVFKKLSEEVGQGHYMRVPIYQRIGELLGGNSVAISFFTSFSWEAPITDGDADIIEEILQNTPLDGKRLTVILNSPGGDGLAAERIINICRSYSKSGFDVIVPKMAKSAATMICFGANSVLMSETSELGPIDPQVPIYDDNGHFSGYQAAHELIESYEELIKRATRTKGRLELYLQQLARYDARFVRRIKSAQLLTESIAVKCLGTGIFKGMSASKIKKKIAPFLDPTFTTDHGRPIYHDVAEKCGLRIRLNDVRDELWREVWSLYVRLNYLVSVSATKVVESATDNYVAAAPRRE